MTRGLDASALSVFVTGSVLTNGFKITCGFDGVVLSVEVSASVLTYGLLMTTGRAGAFFGDAYVTRETARVGRANGLSPYGIPTRKP